MGQVVDFLIIIPVFIVHNPVDILILLSHDRNLRIQNKLLTYHFEFKLIQSLIFKIKIKPKLLILIFKLLNMLVRSLLIIKKRPDP